MNIMMDGDALYPKGFHPAVLEKTQDFKGWARHYDRADMAIGKVKYYFVDFGLSTHFKNPQSSRMVRGIDGRDQEVPELSEYLPYDPFKTDIFILGNVFKKSFCNVL